MIDNEGSLINASANPHFFHLRIIERNHWTLVLPKWTQCLISMVNQLEGLFDSARLVEDL